MYFACVSVSSVSVAFSVFSCRRATFSSRCFGSVYTPSGYFAVCVNSSICAMVWFAKLELIT